MKPQHSYCDHSLALAQLCGTQERTCLWQEPGGTKQQVDLPHWRANRMAVFSHHSLKRHQVLQIWSLQSKYAQFSAIFAMCFNNLSSSYVFCLHSVTLNGLMGGRRKGSLKYSSSDLPLFLENISGTDPFHAMNSSQRSRTALQSGYRYPASPLQQPPAIPRHLSVRY